MQKSVRPTNALVHWNRGIALRLPDGVSYWNCHTILQSCGTSNPLSETVDRELNSSLPV